mgnify:CR=1 FL=1
MDCGGGELLLPFAENGYIVGGCDAGEASIETARTRMADGAFHVGTAGSLDPAVPWHVVMWRYAAAPGEPPDVGQMRGLLSRMFAKATHAIAILDVPEDQRRWMLHALAEIGARAIQIEPSAFGDITSHGLVNVFARV